MIRAIKGRQATILASCVVVACAAPAPKSVRGYVAAGDRAHVEDAVAFRDGIVVRTEAGNLVRYDGTLAFVRDAVAPSPVTTLVAHEGLLYAGLANGDVGRVDEDLRFTKTAHVDGTPRWIGMHGGDLLVVADRTLVRIRDGESKSVTLEYDRPKGHVRGVLVDGDTLWWSIHAGEWGGATGKVDLVAFTSTTIEDTEPIYGVVAHKGRVLRYGGLSHLGSQHGTIGSVDGGVRELWRRSSSPRYRDLDPPGRPVRAMLARGDHLVVALGDMIYETDLQTWTKRATLPDRSRTVALVELRDVLVIATDAGLFTLRGTSLARVTP